MRFKFISQCGFTLVEVLTVMLVLVAIASITVESTKDFVFQGRYDVTKDRYEKIKKAIIGDPNQVINGQPNIEGFVKDVGRLPFKLEELTDGYCSANTETNFYADSVACSAVSGVWNSKIYISSKDVLKDGWGNPWIVNNPVTSIRSLGKDNLAGGSGYDADVQITISEIDWKVDISQLRFLVKSNNNAGLTKIIKTKIANSSITGTASIIEDGMQHLVSFDYSTSNMIPMGNVTIAVYHEDLITKYPANNPDIKITLSPHTTLPTINW